MRLSDNTVLITGGGSGIGLAFAERFLAAGSEVIICGRRAEKLAEAKERFPALHTYVCDVGAEADRIGLLRWVEREFPAINVLVNNAGIQQRVSLAEPPSLEWSYYQQEIRINVEAPIHLSMLFLPLLAGKENAQIINVTSGLAFTPMASAPIYCATKAALHSFTVSLRLQAAPLGVGVIEVVPPAVQTDLGRPGLHTFGAPLNDFADGIFEGLKTEAVEIGYGRAAQAMRMSRDEIDEAVRQMHQRR